MDSFQSHARKTQLKCNKKRLTQDQIRLLETSFSFNKKLDPDRKSQLAQELGLPPRQVAVWYQNKRARWKNQSLEVDYKALQVRLESVLEENERLGREVVRLKHELHKAHDVLISFNTAYNNNHSSIPSLSTSCDEVGSSGLLHDSKQHLDRELFACLIAGDQGQFDKPDGRDFFAPSIS
ncbi:hypothetical protein NMG60_11012782 [Bertholletia excelsa]